MAKLRIMNGDNQKLKKLLGPLADDIELKRGDTMVECDPAVDEQVRTSREVFAAMVKGGYTAFQVDETTGENLGQVKEYDPTVADMVIMVGPMAGG